MHEIEALISDLGLGTDSRRAAAIRELVRIGAEAVSPLCVALSTSNVRGRVGALIALASIGDPRAVPIVCWALRDREGAVRDHAARTLGDIEHPDAVPALLDAVRYCDEHTRVQVIEALGRIGDSRAVPVLRKLLRGWNHALKEEAAEALGRIGDPEALPELCQALQRTSPWALRQAAAHALGRIGRLAAVPALCSAPSDESAETRRARAEALAAMAPDVVPILIEQLTKHEPPSVAADALVLIGRPAVDPLCEVLRSAPASAWLRPRGAASDDGSNLRALAADLLGPIGDLRAVPTLVWTMENDCDLVRISAASSLGILGDESVVGPLRMALASARPALRGRAAVAITRLVPPTPDLIRPLTEALEDPFDVDLRRRAARGLRAIASTQPVPALRSAIPALRRQASPWKLHTDAARSDFERALIAIENATAAMKDLPLPAGTVPDAPAVLPIPAREPQREPGRSY